jgi:hypothetical protein
MSLPVRLAGIPNNATIEVREAEVARVEGNVTVCLQFESEGRIVGEFPPSESIWNVIESLNPAFVQSNPVQAVACIYMRNEVRVVINFKFFFNLTIFLFKMVGKEQLSDTTLRKLGLVSGKVAFRVKVQAELAPEAERYKYNLNIAPRERSASPPRHMKTAKVENNENQPTTPIDKDRYQETDENKYQAGPSRSDFGQLHSSKYSKPQDVVKDKLSLLQSKIFKNKKSISPKSGSVSAQSRFSEAPSSSCESHEETQECKARTSEKETKSSVNQFTLNDLRSKVNEVSAIN